MTSLKSEFTLLGRSETRLPESPDHARLETFPNPSPDLNYWIRLKTEQFTSVCPVTGQPDFAEIEIAYIPDKICVETKSLKFYLASFRNEKAFNERIVTRILADFRKTVEPRRVIVKGAFAERGGLSLSVEAQFPET